ncbi:hypothetical protein C8N32_101151 [Rhodovulum imhoffii]|uniref:Ferric uptake regulation protein n=1 Tax=Rhodovulum imhoffii TaxID=365340 RepID=A0A2T5BWD0_9RHOB|nr:hypothetical protein [Rhodovulum imhoffii]MBK5935081.1 hypothetical protein [Rhodovulum imhoffii]PTN03954.1 hypothetical protein C8N32_101151 [Rhodovulum imhoffii]
MPDLEAISELRIILREMERDVGLDCLSRTERDVYLAARQLSKLNGSVVNSDEIRHHVLVRDIPQATFYRSLRALINKSLLQHAEGWRAKNYTVQHLHASPSERVLSALA